LLADLSRHITLLPGDVILSGTPANSRPMANGDVVEVEVEGIGRLSNRVVEVPAPAEAVGHQPTDSGNVRAVALGLGKRGGMSQ
jgi:5-oxopent-3-ene-1,2,5-tricarboxylate decarboxylase / 2-hydroxyhepta-2,4-diene-1,7-dioate isomerase